MFLVIKRLKTILLDIPSVGKLAYSLFRDSRVPLTPKLALIAALGFIVSPLDLPGWIPVAGELDVLALTLLAVKLFIRACPKELVEEHRATIAAGEGAFDSDMRAARGQVWEKASGLFKR